MKWVYDFSEGDASQKYLLGGKGANLAEMTNLGLPVPPGFTITTEACNAYREAGSASPTGCSTRSPSTASTSKRRWVASSATRATHCSSPCVPAPRSRCRG